MPEHHTVIIVGAGITGLATAWWLHKSGGDVIVLENGSAAGGTMKTAHTDGWLIETGPNSASRQLPSCGSSPPTSASKISGSMPTTQPTIDTSFVMGPFIPCR